jgi:hypothetical protein
MRTTMELASFFSLCACYTNVLLDILKHPLLVDKCSRFIMIACVNVTWKGRGFLERNGVNLLWSIILSNGNQFSPR